jgi:hypothetical protein
MKSSPVVLKLLFAPVCTGGPGALRAASPVSELPPTTCAGQVFLSWHEAETPAGTTFNVYVAAHPLRDVAGAAHQGFVTYWDNGKHPTAGKNAPADVKAWAKAMHRFRLNESFPAFSDTSSNRNPGEGDPAEGDIIGWMNRGLDWSEIEDAANHYAITLRADFPEVEYPVRTTITLRRTHDFKPKAGERPRRRVRLRSRTPRLAKAPGAGTVRAPL